MKHQQKLQGWMQRELDRHVNHMILDDGRGNVMAFGKFMLAKNDQGVEVSTFSDTVDTFTNFATAISYCPWLACPGIRPDICCGACAA